MLFIIAQYLQRIEKLPAYVRVLTCYQKTKREPDHTTPREEGKTKMGELFGTDGERGVAHEFPMTSEMALNIGRATTYLFKRMGHSPRIFIGKDARISGYMLEKAIVSGICPMEVNAILVGPMPTPGIAFLTSSMRTGAETEKYCKRIADVVREKRG